MLFGEPIMQAIYSGESRQPAAAAPADFIPLDLETSTHVPTPVMCRHMHRQEQTARGWASAETYPPELKPVRIMGRLSWPVAGIKRAWGSPNDAWTHPKLHNDFKHELDFARDTDPAVGAKAREPFKWLNAHKAETLLFNALAQCVPLTHSMGEEGRPELWRAPTPSGAANCVGIVITLDDKGRLRCVGSNILTMPEQTADPCPADFLEKFDAAGSPAEKARVIQKVIPCAASTGQHMEWVQRVFREGRRYRTMSIYLVVDQQYFFATTALVEGPRQSKLALEFTGSVRP